MAKAIKVKRGSITQLAKLFECTEQTIRNSIRGVTEGEMPERIRVEAVKQGFVIEEKIITMAEYKLRYAEK